MKIRMAFVAILLGVVVSASGQSEDVEDCKDSPLLTRMTGCFIEECDYKDFDGLEFQTGPILDSGEYKKKDAEGKKASIVYRCPASTSDLQIIRNVEAAFKKSGFVTAFSGRNPDDWRTITMSKGPQWVQVIAHEPHEQGTVYELRTVLVKAMEQELAATADAWAETIAKSGRVSVYGINFATGKATLNPDSTPVLKEIVKLLKANASWKLRVEGHTDNVGSAATNKTLSLQRATSVVKWLVAQGIAATRLTSKGLGDSVPAADNATDEGRAKNRRVDLVKM